jgi:hypothetical protein
MTNEGRPGPPHCGVSGRRLAARAYARRAPARRDARKDFDLFLVLP